jgi:phosphoglycolate phosphatase-like HAD superfamily hydrolase
LQLGNRHTARSTVLLLLFDIDGTLLQRASAEHRDAVHAALHDVYGVHDAGGAHVDAAGRTDVEIARHILLLRGIDAAAVDARLGDFRAAVTRRYAQLGPSDLSAHVPAGMAALLAALHARRDRRLSLVTGNLEPIARLKLRAAQLSRFFAAGEGAFGSDHEDRSELPAIARARAGRHFDGRPWPRERTVVIGDTPRDIACARADGVRCVAVTTGPYDAGRLAGADAVATSVQQLGAVLHGLR